MALLVIVVASLVLVTLFGFPKPGLSLALLVAFAVGRAIYLRLSQHESLSIIDLKLNGPVGRADSAVMAAGEARVEPDAPTQTRRAHSIPIDEPLRLRVAQRDIFDLIRQELQRALGDAYVVGDEVGRGGFGVVVAARDSVLARDLAIKVVGRHKNDDALVRFQREAAILASLRHPHIVPVHFFGSTRDFVFMVMPRIVGQSLRALIESRSVSINDRRITHGTGFPEIRRILEQTAGALDVAHRANVVHRDVKPENLLLEGPSRYVQVVDFGVAKLVDPLRRGIVGTVIGTWGYMSPEQITGSPDIDHRSDIYSLGCVVYELIAGRTPFLSPNDGIMALVDYREAHVHQVPPPIRQWRPDCSAQCEQTVLKALAKRSTDRFQTAGEFAEAFSAALKD